MRVLIIADCVPVAHVDAVARGVVTRCEATFSAALGAIRAREVDAVVSPEAIGEQSSISCLDVAQVARAYGVACVIVTDVWVDGSYGAAAMQFGGDVGEAIARAVRIRGAMRESRPEARALPRPGRRPLFG